MRLNRFRPSLPGPRRRPSRPFETNPSSRLFRPSLPGPRRRLPRPLETSPLFRLFRCQHRRRQVPPVSAPARTHADHQHFRQQVSPVSAPEERVQIKSPRHVEVGQASQTFVLLVHHPPLHLHLTCSRRRPWTPHPPGTGSHASEQVQVVKATRVAR